MSPLTTLVQQQIDSTGQTLAQARDFIQVQAGLAVSPLADFTTAANADNQKAALVGRLALLTAIKQADAVATAVGQTDLSGGTVSQADVNTAVASAVAGALPAIGAAASDPALTGASGSALQAALDSAASATVQQIALTVPELVAGVGVAKLPPDVSAAITSEATASLHMLQYVDANHWYMRVNQASAADSTPDANNMQHYYSVRTRMAPYAYDPTLGVAKSWVDQNDFEGAGNLHWNGSDWVACKLGDRNATSMRDAQGRSSYDYCDGLEKGTGVRSAVDIAGQSLATVIADKIRSFPGAAVALLFTMGPK